MTLLKKQTKIFFSTILYVFISYNIACCENFFVNVSWEDAPIICNAALINNNELKCTQDDTALIYELKNIKSITYKNMSLYPYKNKKIFRYEDVNDSNCQNVLDAIIGPLYLENNENIFFLLGKMYENGLCVQKSTENAVSYYQKSGKKGESAYYELMKKLTPPVKKAEVDSEYLKKLQEDSDRKRAKKEKWSQKCQSECTVTGSVYNKFRYSTKCYNDCMSYMD